MKTVHPSVEDLYLTIKSRKDGGTAVILIYDEIHSFTDKSTRGKKAMDLYRYGLVGVYTRKVSIEELKEDIEFTRNIINNRSVG